MLFAVYQRVCNITCVQLATRPSSPLAVVVLHYSRTYLSRMLVATEIKNKLTPIEGLILAFLSPPHTQNHDPYTPATPFKLHTTGSHRTLQNPVAIHIIVHALYRTFRIGTAFSHKTRTQRDV